MLRHREETYSVFGAVPRMSGSATVSGSGISEDATLGAEWV